MLRTIRQGHRIRWPGVRGLLIPQQRSRPPVRARRALVVMLASAVVFAGTASEISAEDSAWGEKPWPAEDTETDAFAAPEFDLYGSLTSLGETQLGDAEGTSAREDLLAGGATRARIKGDWEPSDTVLFHAELVAEHLYGTLNPYAYAQASGIDDDAAAALQHANPQDDFADFLYVDQAWAQVRFSRVDLQVGRQPIAWGTGYAFNPTVRTHLERGFVGFNEEATPGTAAVAAGVPILGPVVAEGYLAFEDRTHSTFTSGRQSDPTYLPWGGRLRMLLAGFDIGLGAVHEVVARPPSPASNTSVAPEHYLHAAGETVGAIGEVGLYAEAAWTMPVWDYRKRYARTWDPWEALESTVGIEYAFPADVEAKLEYYRRGDGATGPARYDVAPILQGLARVMARDYLFAYLGRTFFSYLEVSLSGLVNLTDGSALVVQQNSYAFSDNFTASIGVLVPTGRGTDEFGGRRRIGAEKVRLVKPTALVELEVSF